MLFQKLLPLLLPVAAVACRQAPVGGVDWAALRREMVEDQIVGRGRDVHDPRVIAAMAQVPRHDLVPADVRAFSYQDRALPIGYGQTISQPDIVAYMTEKLAPRWTDRVLEVGTGSGYQAAVLSKLVREVYTVEIVEPLARRAASDLERLGYDNVRVRVGDGYAGWPEAAPFDAIIVTCAPDHVPQPLVEQLAEGGRLVIPVGPPEAQELVLLEKRDGKLEQRAALPVLFVPMTGKAAGKK
jgi:protein-L-isoaspartate(D-aspartate) O-methyltransferase